MSGPDWEGFGRAIMEDWPDVGGLDGFDLQEIALKHGVLVPQLRTDYCSVDSEGDGNCNCAEYGAKDDNPNGWECYRLAAPRS